MGNRLNMWAFAIALVGCGLGACAVQAPGDNAPAQTHLQSISATLAPSNNTTAKCNIEPAAKLPYLFDTDAGPAFVEVSSYVARGECAATREQCLNWLNEIGADLQPQFHAPAHGDAPQWLCQGGHSETYRQLTSP